MRCILLSFLAALVLTTPAQAASIQPVGVIGNSGAAGDRLLKTGAFTRGACSSGAAVADDMTIWVSGGDSINRIGPDGGLLERFPLEPAAARVNSATFAVLDNRLYFFCNVPPRGARLFELPMESGRTAKAIECDLPPAQRYALAAQPLDGKLVLAAGVGDNRIAVLGVRPARNGPAAVERLFELPGTDPQGVAVDAANRVLYIGARFGSYMITAVRPDGSPAYDGFPIPCMKTPAIPTQFRGLVSLAGGALWDTAWYGFVARFNLRGANAPGRVTEWSHELDYPTQVVELQADHPRYDALVFTSPTPDEFYYAWWDKTARQLLLRRRFGCLPTITNLGISHEGHVTVGMERSQLWWKWDDGPDTPPRKADIHIAITPGFFAGDRMFAICAQYELNRNSPLCPTIFEAKRGSRNEARRITYGTPMKEPVGLSVKLTPGKNEAELFVTDAETRSVWRTDFYLPALRPNDAKWRTVAVNGTQLNGPTDIAALTDGRLILADAGPAGKPGRILMLEPDGDAYRVAWAFDQWGDRPGDRFGSRLRMAVDGHNALVSDTDRHRVVWMDWTTRTVLGYFGTTDTAGNDAMHLDRPSLVSVAGERAVVADTGNQRVMKLKLRP